MRAMCFEVREPHVLPRLAAVGGLVDAVAPRAALAVVVLAAADPHGVGVIRIDRDVADRHHVIEVVEVHGPRGAVVHGLPQPAGGGADVKDGGVRLEHRKIVDTAGHGGRADVPELEPGKWISWRRERRGCRRRPLLRHGSSIPSNRNGQQHSCQGETGKARKTHTHARSSNEIEREMYHRQRRSE